MELSGAVQVKADAKANWADAKVNVALDKGATVRTGPDGKAVLRGAKVAGITMQANSTVEAGSLTIEGDTTKADCKALGGTAYFLINKLKTQDSSFTGGTPTAIVGVRGTVFAIKVADDAASSRGAVFVGEVSVSGRGDEPGWGS